MPMLILPLYDSRGADLDDANLSVINMIAEAFGGCPVTYPAQVAAHSMELACVDAMPGLAVEWQTGTDSASTRAMVATIARRYTAETAVPRLLYFRDAFNPEVLEIEPAGQRKAAAG